MDLEIHSLCKLSKRIHWKWRESVTPKNKDNPKRIYVELNDRKKQQKEINYTQILWNHI